VHAKARRRAALSRDERLRHRVPEVIVKVISPGSNCLRAVRQHFIDLQSRHGRSLEMDFFNNPVVGREAVAALIDDWDLDLDELFCRVTPLGMPRKTPTKLVHKIVFSMPAGTRADRLLLAVRHFAEDVFGPRHRYALALHTDERHPHVHVVVKAMSEQGRRLHILKPRSDPGAGLSPVISASMESPPRPRLDRSGGRSSPPSSKAFTDPGGFLTFRLNNWWPELSGFGRRFSETARKPGTIV
jgi:Relaxase/Mobilisation nuclease domain